MQYRAIALETVENNIAFVEAFADEIGQWWVFKQRNTILFQKFKYFSRLAEEVGGGSGGDEDEDGAATLGFPTALLMLVAATALAL